MDDIIFASMLTVFALTGFLAIPAMAVCNRAVALVIVGVYVASVSGLIVFSVASVWLDILRNP